MSARMIPDRSASPPPADAADELRSRLRSADGEELARLIAGQGDDLDPSNVRNAFRNPFLEAGHIEALAALPRLIRSYEIRRAIVTHPRTPRALALAHVGGLYWADLTRIGVDTRLHPIVRRAADRRLLGRLAGLAVGERTAVARGCSAAVIGALRLDPTPRVVRALLENPRLTEGLLLPLVISERANPRVLALVASDRRWGVRLGVRKALCRNPATPVADALRALAALPATELAAIAADSRVAAAVRERARGLLRGRRAGSGREV
jgi:hypothetical protein